MIQEFHLEMQISCYHCTDDVTHVFQYYLYDSEYSDVNVLLCLKCHNSLNKIYHKCAKCDTDIIEYSFNSESHFDYLKTMFESFFDRDVYIHEVVDATNAFICSIHEYEKLIDLIKTHNFELFAPDKYFRYALNSIVEELNQVNKENELLREHIKCMPDGEFALKALEDFQNHQLNKNNIEK